MHETYLIYDGSFEGLLCSIFKAYELKSDFIRIIPEHLNSQQLFATTIRINTQETAATRVLTGLQKILSKSSVSKLMKVYLSELEGSEDLIYRVCKKVFAKQRDILTNYADPDVLNVSKIVKSVHRERHRMEAFIRFKLTKDQIYWANVEPDFNVLPLIKNHFKKRYADQKWIIYDIKRNYGLYYDLQKIEMVIFDFDQEFDPTKTSEKIFDSREIEFQRLWKGYFNSSNIKSRKNMKLHIQHVPKRYWKYLVEKQ